MRFRDVVRHMLAFENLKHGAPKLTFQGQEQLVRRVLEQSYSLFALPSEVKDIYAQPVEQESGYRHVVGLKEMFLLRNRAYPLPLKNIEELWCMCINAARRILENVELALQMPMGCLVGLLDGQTQVPVESNASMLRFFRYEGRTQTDVCAAHTDVGLLSFVFRSTYPALEGMKPCGAWEPLEAELAPDEVLVMPGRLLSLLTNGALTPLLHRVPPVPHSRYSMVFQAIPAPLQRLESEAFFSPIAGAFTTPFSFCTADWIRYAHKMGVSVNA